MWRASGCGCAGCMIGRDAACLMERLGSRSSQGSRLGQTGAQATSWTSDTLVVCKAAAGVGQSLLVARTAGQLSGSMSTSASYDDSSASSVALVNEGTTGGGSVTVVGADFGASRCVECGGGMGRGEWDRQGKGQGVGMLDGAMYVYARAAL